MADITKVFRKIDPQHSGNLLRIENQKYSIISILLRMLRIGTGDFREDALKSSRLDIPPPQNQKL